MEKKYARMAIQSWRFLSSQPGFLVDNIWKSLDIITKKLRIKPEKNILGSFGYIMLQVQIDEGAYFIRS